MTTEQNKSPPQHTPLPWKTQPLKASAFHGNGTIGDEKLIGFKIDNGSIEDIVTVDCRGRRDKEIAAANAMFIVSACNSHYDLLQACEAALADYRQYIPGATTVPDILRSAIAKARGQQ